MKRHAIFGLGAALATVCLTVSGCGGGGMSEGMPQDVNSATPARIESRMGPPSRAKATHGKVGGRSIVSGPVRRV